jgi:hypothetical protein
VRNSVATTNGPRSTAIRASGLLGVDSLLDAVFEARLLRRDRLEVLLTLSLGIFATPLLGLVLALETCGLAVRDGFTLIGKSETVAFQGNHVRVGNSHVSGLQDLTTVGALADPANDVGVLNDFLG